MKVLTVLMEKGGDGKTTMAVNIAAEMAARGHNVVLVDCDPQANATVWLRQGEAPAIHDLLVRDAAWNDCLRSVPPAMWDTGKNYDDPQGTLLCVPSNMETRVIPLSLSDIFKLDSRLAQLEGMSDLVVIDTPPTPSLFHNSILLATDYVILPSRLETMSLRQASKTLLHADAMKTTRERNQLGTIQVLGIIPNQYRATTSEHNNNLARLQERYDDLVWEPVGMRTVWGEAPHAQMAVSVYAPNSEAAREMAVIAERIEDEIFGEVIYEQPA